MRRLGLVFALLLILSGSARGADRARFAVTNFNMSFLAAGAALKRGYFKEEGLDAEVIRMNANVAIAALASGEVDYSLIFGSVVRAAMRGLPLRVIANFIDGSTHALVARPEFKSIKELRGRTLGVQAYGATEHVAALMMFKHFGIDAERDLKIIALGPASARLAALKERVVDVVVVSPPADAEARKAGFHLLARAYELFKFPFVGLGTNLKKIQERPDEVKRALRALIRANRFIRENKEGAIQVLMEWGKTDRESAASGYDAGVKVLNPDGTIPEEGLRLVIEQAKKEMKIGREVLPSEVADVTLLGEAQRELGLGGQ